MVKILIVDKQRGIRNILREKLAFEGYDVSSAEDLGTTLDLLSQGSFNIIVCEDIIFEEYISKYEHISGKYVVIVMAASQTVESAVRIMRCGVHDYIAKPIDMNRLLDSLKEATGNLTPSNESTSAVHNRTKRRASSVKPADSINCSDFIIGESTPIIHVKGLINKVAPSDARVLITGPNGTGKELVARALHMKSNRHAAPFIEVNCAAIPSELIESELFGHEKGAFTSAIKQRKGKFELANGGTLFLDEIGDMCPSAQAKVLRVLQENRLTRVGGDSDIEVDVRIIAATNKDLRAEICAGKFREDLYHRLSVILIPVPPLCERLDDIPLLVDHFVTTISSEYGIDPKPVEQEAIEALKSFSWSGNIRELRNVIERLIILGGEPITSDDVQNYAIGVM